MKRILLSVSEVHFQVGGVKCLLSSYCRALGLYFDAFGIFSQELPKRLQKRYSRAMLGLGAQCGTMNHFILVEDVAKM